MWAIIEKIDEETSEETCHIVPYVEVENSFPTEAEALTFAAEREAAQDSVTDDKNVIIGIHKGHTLSATCVCNPKVSESDPALWIHNAAN